MIEKLRDASQRIRRNIAQRGLRNAMNNLVDRVRTRNFSSAPAAPLVLEGTHPFDEAAGLDTGGYIHGSQLQSGHPNDLYAVSYYGSAPSVAESVLQHWLTTPPARPVEEFTFIDFGSGKGRVVLLASKLPFRKCIGVELNPGLNAIATENMKRWKELGNAVSPMEAVCQDVTEFEFPDTPCLFYLYNPFTSKVLAKLLDHIAQAFAERPGEADLLYVNAEFSFLLEERPGFTRLWDMPVPMSAEDSETDLLKTIDKSRQRSQDELLHEPCNAWRWMGDR